MELRITVFLFLIPLILGETEVLSDVPSAEAGNVARRDLSETRDLLLQSRRKTATAARLYDYTNYDSLTARYIPDEQATSQGVPYVITAERLKRIREQFMYWYFDKGGSEDIGDLQKDIHSSTSQVHKNFNFQLPFYGFRFNYTRVSINGYLEFSDPPPHYNYPLSFPNKDWPKENDPSFIGIFFSKCRIGRMEPAESDQRPPGVYFRLERDLHRRTDMFGVEVRERLMWDIREGVVGSDSFIPKHAVFITWKNVTFAGGIDESLYKTNTFQIVLATDEVYTYAIFNYLNMKWTTHTEARGDTASGEGGIPAFVGFNAGNGTGSTEYRPYSQNSVIRDLTSRGYANGFPGRHIFRIDEKIMLGTCNKDIAGTDLPLVFAPESGNMLGGTVVNITGPCFESGMKIRCRFDTEDVFGEVVDRNRAICIQPYLNAEGYVRFEVSVDERGFNWKGKYFVETPATALERIQFLNNAVHERYPAAIPISWDRNNITSNAQAGLTISIYGYKETTIRPQLMYIDVLEINVPNTGNFTITPNSYSSRRNSPELLELEFGFIMINLTDPTSYQGLQITPVLWSRPIPLGWYFASQWQLKYGADWPVALCDKWLMYDRYLKNFAAEIPVCPCKQDHAVADKGRFLPDFSCDKDINPECMYHKGAVHCVRSGAPSNEGSEQQCCYNREGLLMLSYDQQWGSRPRRSHNLGFIPWNEANKVPSLSQWFHDVIPFYSCCLWQDEQAVGCETLRFERRPTQDCVAYQSPYVATVFGDPHIITFDGLEYTFNGKGEYVLVNAKRSGKEMLNVQGRFEQPAENMYGEVRATQLTAIAAQDNSSTIIEVRLRPRDAQWRYRLDVVANKNKKIYFDRSSLKIQHFPGVTVYTPSSIIDQSQVIIMFPSGAGVEVIENKGFMTARVYLSWNFSNKTQGLFGNWSFDIEDDLVNPDGTIISTETNMNNVQAIHEQFGINWLLQEGKEDLIGSSLFAHDVRPASFYTNRTFVPEYRILPEDILPANRSYDVARAKELCGQSYQCKYDYAMTLNRDLAQSTLDYRTKYMAIREINQETVVTCGVLETPRFGRKSNFYFTPGTKVTFECNQDFTLVGDKRRTCLPEGRWDIPQYGYTECLRRTEYEQQQGWFAGGIILAVMVPLAIIILCIYFFVMKDRNKFKNYAKSKLPVFDKSMLRNSAKRNKPPTMPSDSYFDPVKTNRTYDKTYRTNEPLPNKPEINFENRESSLQDVKEEDLQGFKEAIEKSDKSKDASVHESSSASSSEDEETNPNVEKNAVSSGDEAPAKSNPSSKRTSKRSVDQQSLSSSSDEDIDRRTTMPIRPAPKPPKTDDEDDSFETASTSDSEKQPLREKKSSSQSTTSGSMFAETNDDTLKRNNPNQGSDRSDASKSSKSSRGVTAI